jgi:hypothetical protein
MGGTPMGGPVLNGFPPGGGGMQNMGNNPGVNMQMAVPQMNQQGIAAAQQVKSHFGKCFVDGVLIFRW